MKHGIGMTAAQQYHLLSLPHRSIAVLSPNTACLTQRSTYSGRHYFHRRAISFSWHLSEQTCPTELYHSSRYCPFFKLTLGCERLLSGLDFLNSLKL